MVSLSRTEGQFRRDSDSLVTADQPKPLVLLNCVPKSWYYWHRTIPVDASLTSKACTAAKTHY